MSKLELKSPVKTHIRPGWRQVEAIPDNAKFHKVMGLYLPVGVVYRSIRKDGCKLYHVHRVGGTEGSICGYHDCYIVEAHPNFQEGKLLAKKMRLGKPWKYEDCLNLCQLAGLKWEWMKGFDENIIYAAADELGVDIG